jgi:hypothetical protein
MLNLIQKFHALLVSEEVNIWHFPAKKEGPRFYFWLKSQPSDGEGYGFVCLDDLINAAYARIDPLAKPLPSVAERDAINARIRQLEAQPLAFSLQKLANQTCESMHSLTPDQKRELFDLIAKA